MAQYDKRSLRGVKIFESLSPETLHRLEQRCRWRTYRPGQEVIAFRGNATEVYFMISGAAQVIIHASTGKDVPFRHLGPGDIFGEFAAIDGKPRSASIDVLETSEVASMSSWDFRNIIDDEPEIAMALLTHLTAQVRRLSTRIYEFSTLAVRNRIHAELVRLARAVSRAPADILLQPAPTHLEIANRVSTHREAVTRELRRLAELGVVERQGTSLMVKDLPRLQRMVQEAKGE